MTNDSLSQLALFASLYLAKKERWATPRPRRSHSSKYYQGNKTLVVS
ncbi:hypothetical protein LC605_07025 [Nostoc sp. CHAB 5836]|nr:hypothetical protein [Nostoc sp. CHAB 5836]MCC5614827.1 hypothetical protein [Nostoc sp. CHAB 5836]